MTAPAGTILAMDTGAPEFVLTHIESVGRPVEYYAEVVDGGDLVRYDLGDVRRFAPPGANAFLLESAHFADASGRQLLLRFKYFLIRRGAGDPRNETV